MTDTEIRIARRLATYMLEVAEQKVDMHFFQGLGLGLGVVFEETTGRTASNKKPKEIIQWALNLPQVPYSHVGD